MSVILVWPMSPFLFCSPREGKRCLFILTELCEKDTLKDWLMKHNGKDSRNRKGVVNFFEQVSIYA